MTVPLAAILGLCDTPGEVAAFGPVDADVTRDLIRAAGLHPATRWCVTVVSPDGQAIGHGCAQAGTSPSAFSPNGPSQPPETPAAVPGHSAPRGAAARQAAAAPQAARQPAGGGSSPPGGGSSPPGGGVDAHLKFPRPAH